MNGIESEEMEMQKYRVVEKPLTLATGRIELTEEQAAVRKTWLKPLRNDCYEILAPIYFKIGEEIGLQDLDKFTMTCVEPVEADLTDPENEKKILDAIDEDVKKTRNELAHKRKK